MNNDLKNFIAQHRKKNKVTLALDDCVLEYYRQLAKDKNSNLAAEIQQALLEKVPPDILLPEEIENCIVDGAKDYLKSLNILDVNFFANRINGINDSNGLYWLIDEVLKLNLSVFEKRVLVNIMSQTVLTKLKERIFGDDEIRALVKESVERNLEKIQKNLGNLNSNL